VSWTVLLIVVATLGIALLVQWLRRSELARYRIAVERRSEVRRQGGDEARLQHPVVDLTRCLGCATCAAVCPEEGVIEIVHGQAVVVNGARCMGIAACERECPVGAITVTVSNLKDRTDIPALTGTLEAHGTPGLFLAGEVTAHALIKTAIEHGTAVAAQVAEAPRAPEGIHDLCIVGAGPAGLACSLEAKRHGLDFVTLDQEVEIGGTVAKYPRRKLVLLQPVDLPLHGRLKNAVYTKEELIGLWQRIAERHELPIRCGEVFEDLTRDEQGNFVVQTGAGTHRARHVCLALGRSGVPRRLGVPGEASSKVAFSLLDAQSYRDRKLLVVGGGDAAVEAALALAEQPGNEVTLSYRKEAFFRVGPRNEERLEAARRDDRVSVLFDSHVRSIANEVVELDVGDESCSLPNDEVFVMTGGTAPTELLGKAGVHFDSENRTSSASLAEQGTGLLPALTIGFLLALGSLLWALVQFDYYGLDAALRPTHHNHGWLRPGRGLGLALGCTATLLVVVNLLYLVRRSPRFRFHLGSLQTWMTSHIATGILALLCALLHGAMAPRETPGGHALWALAVLLVTGGIGRYFYAYIPRAANGRELELAEVKERLRSLAVDRAQFERIQELIDARQWRSSFFGRLIALFGVHRDWLRHSRHMAETFDGDEEMLRLARQAYRAALVTAHYEDLRAVLGTWRFVHRWIAILMVLLLVVHIAHALFYGGVA